MGFKKSVNSGASFYVNKNKTNITQFNYRSLWCEYYWDIYQNFTLTEWYLQIGTLREIVDHHIKEEESVIFSDGKKLLSKKQANQLTIDMENLKEKMRLKIKPQSFLQKLAGLTLNRKTLSRWAKLIVLGNYPSRCAASGFNAICNRMLI